MLAGQDYRPVLSRLPASYALLAPFLLLCFPVLRVSSALIGQICLNCDLSSNFHFALFIPSSDSRIHVPFVDPRSSHIPHSAHIEKCGMDVAQVMVVREIDLIMWFSSYRNLILLRNNKAKFSVRSFDYL